MNFIVVELDQDCGCRYDCECNYVEGVKFIKSFSTEEEAKEFVREKKEEYDNARKVRIDYIEQWVDAIEIPQSNWEEFLNKYDLANHTSPRDFNWVLKKNLQNDYYIEIEGYNPPLADLRWNSLFVVEIK